ncbi:MAG: ABC transporter ATP-binding protein, partial [bacterium]
MNNFSLETSNNTQSKPRFIQSILKLLPLLKSEKTRIMQSTAAVLTNSVLSLLGPLVFGLAVDKFIVTNNYRGIIPYGAALLAIYLVSLAADYLQTIIMGTVGQNILYTLRHDLFTKLQALPISFFNQNKAGDLISRINNDTDKLNQFMSQGLVQFFSNIITIFGAAIFIIFINWRVGLLALIPAALLLLLTQAISPWIKRANKNSLSSTGNLSAEISESLNNFKIIVAFNRRDYFQEKFNKSNELNYALAVKAGIANNTLTPAYGLAANIAQLIVLGYGLYLVSFNLFTIGLLISFITYVNRLYDPLRQMARIWSSFQTALASYDRISHIMSLESDLQIKKNSSISTKDQSLIEFKNVNFGY